MADKEIMATGRRKTSIAVVKLVKGKGRIFVNGKTLRNYIGNRPAVEGGTWYLWCDSYLITSGNTRDLHAVKNVPHHDSDGLWNDIELDYTPVSTL